MKATPKLEQLCDRFRHELLERGARVRATQSLPCPQPQKPKQKLCKHISKYCKFCVNIQKNYLNKIITS